MTSLGRLIGALLLTATLALPPAWADAVGAASPFEQGRSLFASHRYAEALEAFHQVSSDDPAYAWAQLYLKTCEQRLREGVGPAGAAVVDQEGLRRRLEMLHEEQREARSSRLEHDRTARRLETAAEAAEEQARSAWERQQRREAKLRARAQRLAQALGPSLAPAPRTSAAALVPPGPPSSPVATAPQPAASPGEAPLSLSAPLVAPPAPAARPAEPPALETVSVGAVHGQPAVWPPPRPVNMPSGAVEVKADRVEYDAEGKRMIATGHVVVDYKEARLTGRRAIIYTETKEAYAEGNAQLLQGQEWLAGELLHYNLATRHGQVLVGQGLVAPWYFHGPEMRQVSAHQVAMVQGYATTCEFDPPHYRFQARQAEVFLDDKIIMRRGTFYVDTLPVFYYPRWTYSLKENQAKVQLIPGKHKEWGPFLLTKWRYELNKNAKGLVHMDWRNNFGWGQGVDLKYRSKARGEGILRTYYNESTDRMDPATKPSRYNRHWVEWRHRWQLDPETQAIVQFEKFSDTEFRKQFLFRERFTEETTEESFLSVIRSKPSYTLSTILKKRVNRTDAVQEQLPSVRLTLNEAPVGETPFFYQGRLSYEQLNDKVAAPSDTDSDVTKVDTFNQLSYAAKLGFINLTPRIGMQQTYFSKDNRDGQLKHPHGMIRGALSGGFDATTRFFRIFNVHTNALGLDIHQLRHIVSPSVAYDVVRRPTVPSSRLVLSDGIEQKSQFAFTLENKLQTKRRQTAQVRTTASTTTDITELAYQAWPALEGEAQRLPGAEGSAVAATVLKKPPKLQSVDLARLILSLPYDVHPKGGSGSRFGNLTADLELLPYSWLRVESDVTYDNHLATGVDSRFITWNLDAVVSPTDRWYVGSGYRYSRNDKTETTTEAALRLGKKWTLRSYWRYTFKEVAGGIKRFNNLRETQYVLTRDLHDWFLDVIYHVDREFGEEIYFVLRWKAFPQVPLETKVSYNQPKYGSQSSPFSPISSQQTQ